MSTQAYNFMIERTLEDSFLPRCNMKSVTKAYEDVHEAEDDNFTSKLECEETLNRKFRNATQMYPERVSKKLCTLDDKVIIL